MIPRAIIPSLTDFVALQNDCLHLLLSAPALHAVNIIEERKFLMLSDVEISALWMNPRTPAGPTGAGIIVEMVKARVTDQNVSGPVFDLQLGFAVLEERNLNLTPGAGTGLTAEQICQLILDCLHLQSLGGIGTLRATGIAPATDWIDADSGIIAHRAQLELKNPRSQTQRCAPVAMAVEDGLCTLTCATNEAQIYFINGGFDPAGNALEPGMPAPSNTGGGAQLYEAPFAIQAGQIIRACAFKPALNQGPVNRLIAP